MEEKIKRRKEKQMMKEMKENSIKQAADIDENRAMWENSFYFDHLFSFDEETLRNISKRNRLIYIQDKAWLKINTKG
jgi:hypothetical protein